MIRIPPNHPIFWSNDFKKDRHRFCLIEQNLSEPTVVLYSDEISYVVCRGNVHGPTWIWTCDDFLPSKISEIEQAIVSMLEGGLGKFFICKPEIYELLAQDQFEYIDVTEYFEMSSLYCEQPVPPQLCDGYVGVPSNEDKMTIAKYRQLCSLELNDGGPITLKDAAVYVQEMCEDKTLHVWKNDFGKLVSMARCRIVGDQSRINNVYTVPDERRKGYAANLIYDLTTTLIDNKITPILFTDSEYEASNATYKSIGYKDMGNLIRFKCSLDDE